MCRAVRSELTALADCAGVSVSMCYVSDSSPVCLDCFSVSVSMCYVCDFGPVCLDSFSVSVMCVILVLFV